MNHAPARRGEPRLAALASWLVLAASFGLSAATWIALARLAGFDGQVHAFGAQLALAWLMPLAVDGYVVVALVLWTAPVPANVARFARANTYAAAGVGVAAQSAYHALLIWDRTGTPWRAALAMIVGAIPPAGAALSVHMRALVRRESRTTTPPPTAVSAPDSPPVTGTTTGQVTAPVQADTPPDSPAAEPEVPRPTKRPFPVTQRAAAALQSDGWKVPEIAQLLDVSERTVRRALQPVPVGAAAAAERA